MTKTHSTKATDWSKVPMDTKIEIRDGDNIRRRHFSHYNKISEQVCFFTDGLTSQDKHKLIAGCSSSRCKLVEE